MRVHLALHHAFLNASEKASSEVIRKLLARIILHAAIMAW